MVIDAQREDARSEPDARLLGQIRAANEQLVLATLRAEELAEAAEVARAAALYSEQRFRALVSTAATVVWEAPAADTITIDRDAWVRFTGTWFDISKPWSWLQLVHPEDRAGVRLAWSTAFATGTPYTMEHRVVTGEGGHAWVLARAVPVVVDGVARDWIGMMTDITDRVRIDEARERFVGVVGHDLRNPLAAISLGAETLRGMPEPLSRVSEQIVQTVHRMDLMIRDMMTFSRGRSGGGIPLTKVPCDLGVLALDVTRDMRRAHAARALTCDVLGDLVTECDRARAEQLFANLLGNAIAHGDDPVRITVTGHVDDILISVRNGGAPIPPAVIATLFEPFARRDQGRPRAGIQGLGLGLYIVREIVAAHGGSIALSSTHQDGTEIAIRWPRHVGRPRDTPPP